MAGKTSSARNSMAKVFGIEISDEEIDISSIPENQPEPMSTKQFDLGILLYIFFAVLIILSIFE